MASALAVGELGMAEVKTLTPFYLAEPNEFEHVKETIVKILQKSGIWTVTVPMLSLALAMVRRWTMHEQALEAPDPRITAQSLGIAKSQPVRSLAELAFDLGRSAENEFSHLCFCVEKACVALTRWMWDQKVGEMPELFHVLRDVKLILQDFSIHLKYVKSNPITPAQVEWPYM